MQRSQMSDLLPNRRCWKRPGEESTELQDLPAAAQSDGRGADKT